MDFCSWLSAELGTDKWVVAHRLTDRLRAKGHMLAINGKRFEQLHDQWLVEHPEALLDSLGQRNVALLRAAGLLREPGQP